MPKENSPFNLLAHITSLSTGETFDLGKRLASFLKKGSVVALKGTLGAGKTCFTKGIALGLGITEEITSPSYTVVLEYEAVVFGETIPVYHIDAYRLNGDNDFIAIGGEDMVFGGGISVIEWSERIPYFIPDKAFRVDFEITGDNVRKIRISQKGNSSPLWDDK